MANGKYNYRDFLESLKGFNSPNSISKSPNIIVIFGPSEHLHGMAIQQFRNLWTQLPNTSLQAIDAVEINGDFLSQVWSQESMFEPKGFYIFRRVEKKTDFSKFLGALIDSPPRQHLCFSILSPSIPVKLAAALKGLDHVTIPCFEPAPFEMDRYVQNQLIRHNIKMHPEAFALFRQAIGQDLSTIDNELSKLNLIFTDQKKEIHADDLAPILGFLRQDQVFQLDKLFLTGKTQEALALVLSLNKRGESPLAILGIITAHIRKSLRISRHLKDGLTAEQIAGSLKLPLPVIKSYTGYIRMKSPQAMIQALRLCQKADQQLKGSGIEGDLILSQLVYLL